jgi:cell division protein DivIC
MMCPLGYPHVLFSMKSSGLKILVLLLSMTLATIVCVFGLVLWENYRELEAFRAREARYVSDLQRVQAESALRQEYLNKLLNDPVFFENVVRERLGYAKPDELVFRFEQE